MGVDSLIAKSCTKPAPPEGKEPDTSVYYQCICFPTEIETNGVLPACAIIIGALTNSFRITRLTKGEGRPTNYYE
jgi:hypothetical protein